MLMLVSDRSCRYLIRIIIFCKSNHTVRRTTQYRTVTLSTNSFILPVVYTQVNGEKLNPSMGTQVAIAQYPTLDGLCSFARTRRVYINFIIILFT